MACSAVMYFQGFFLGGELLTLGFVLTASAMALWFRDCVIEGTNYLNLHSIIFVVYLTFIIFLLNKNINLVFIFFIILLKFKVVKFS